MGEKMCTCKACGNQMAKKADFCPNCGVKNKKGKPVVVAVLILVVLIIIAAAAGGNNAPAKGEDNLQTQANNNKDTQTTAKDENDAFGIGETAEMKKIKVSMVSVTESVGSEYNKPAEGNVFVLCEFEIANDSDSEITVSSMLSFTAYCDDYTCTYSLAALMEKGSSNQLDGTVAAGKKLKGVIGYEVPADWEKMEIHFTPDVWSNDAIVFAATKQ